MRRLVIDEIVKQAKSFNGLGNKFEVKSRIELLQNIVLSITATIRPSEPENKHKLMELHFIKECIIELKGLL